MPDFITRTAHSSTRCLRSSTCRPARLPSRKTRTIDATIARGPVSIVRIVSRATSFTSCLTSAIRRASPVTYLVAGSSTRSSRYRVARRSRRSTVRTPPARWPASLARRQRDQAKYQHDAQSFRHECRRDTNAGGRSLFTPINAAQRVGNAGRNSLRSDGINNIDFGILKNTRIGENHASAPRRLLQFH